MDYQPFIFIWIFSIVHSDVSQGEPSIRSPQTEIIAYANYTAKFSCITRDRRGAFVTWSRVDRENQTEKLLNLLFVNTQKYTPLIRYHLTHLHGNDDEEWWNLEIRHVHFADQGYYSCVINGQEKISQLFSLKVRNKSSVQEFLQMTKPNETDSTRNGSLALRSTSDLHQRSKEMNSSSSMGLSSGIVIFLLFLQLC